MQRIAKFATRLVLLVLLLPAPLAAAAPPPAKRPTRLAPFDPCILTAISPLCFYSR
jgi:hypothetical protein